MQFLENLQLLSLSCSAANLLKVEVDKISLVLNASSVTRTIALDAWNSFDRIRHKTGGLYKVKFSCIYENMIFLIETFLSCRRQWVNSKYKSSSKCAINSGIHQNSILVHLILSTLVFSSVIYYVRLLFKLMILPSTQHVTKYVTRRNKLR